MWRERLDQYVENLLILSALELGQKRLQNKDERSGPNGSEFGF